MLSRAYKNEGCLLSSEFDEEPIINLPVGERAFIFKVHVMERHMGRYVAATTPMYKEGGEELYEVTRSGERLLRVRFNLFVAPCAFIER